MSNSAAALNADMLALKEEILSLRASLDKNAKDARLQKTQKTEIKKSTNFYKAVYTRSYKIKLVCFINLTLSRQYQLPLCLS
jgi:hypothetical protein